MRRGRDTMKKTKLAIGGLVAGIGLVGGVVGLLASGAYDSLEGAGWGLGGLVLVGIGGLVAREARTADALHDRALAWIEAGELRWFYVRTANGAVEIVLHASGRRRLVHVLADMEDAAALGAALRSAVPAARVGFRPEWEREWRAG